jgi:hypothetical protein
MDKSNENSSDDLIGFRKRIEEFTRPFTELQRQMDEFTRPLDDLREQLEKTLISHQLTSTVNLLNREIDRLATGIADAYSPLEGFFEELAIVEHQDRLLDKAGFLPHVTTPLQLIDECENDAERLSDLLEQHYRENWPEVRNRFIARIDSYELDGEVKEIFSEALIAHEAGLYRLVCRGLFPEIERIARLELKDPVSTNTDVKESSSGNVIRFLQKIAGDMQMSDLEPQGYLGLRLFLRLTDHLYMTVRDDQLAALKADAVPNRHAAIHGLVVYQSFKNSLNTLFMTDYIMQIVRVIKKQKRLDSEV